jgi:hypothetical protein
LACNARRASSSLSSLVSFPSPPALSPAPTPTPWGLHSRCIYRHTPAPTPCTPWQARGPREGNAGRHPDPTRRWAWVARPPVAPRGGRERAVHVRAPSWRRARSFHCCGLVDRDSWRRAGPAREASGGERRPRRHHSALRLGLGAGADSVQVHRLARRRRGPRAPFSLLVPCFFKSLKNEGKGFCPRLMFSSPVMFLSWAGASHHIRSYSPFCHGIYLFIYCWGRIQKKVTAYVIS